MNDDKTMRTSYLVKRFVPYYRKYRWILILDLFCAALTTVCELALPLIIRYITDMGMNDLAGLTVQMVLRLGAFYLALRLVDVVANYFMTSVGHTMGARIETDMRKDLFSHLQQLSYSYYDSAKIGQIMARITSDLMDVTEFAHHCPEEFFIAAVKIGVAFIILLRMEVTLTLIIFAMLPLMLIFATTFNFKMRRAFKRSRDQIGELNSKVEDSLLGVRVVKSFANEDMEEAKFKEGNEGFLRIKRQAYRYMAGFHSTIRFFDGLMYIVVVIVGAIFMIHRRIEAPDLVAFLLYVTLLLASIRRIVEFTEQFQRGITGIERFIEIMDAPVEVDDAANAIVLPDVTGEVRFDKVSFRYSDNNRNVLSDIDLTVSAGENVALVGPSGSGKTTLCNLIPRFYDVSSGRIL
ncbi:MAG TPA: ABC transporter ATP-binding protein, partial [Anaerovoracaceae bacterium]|nr:ABC transporter ATP-binding protein [Anaerovoracaceae bacterium]